jgi:hypothetical protein
MPKSIKTHYVKRGYATSEDIVLNTTPRTRTIFRPGLHAGDVRGKIVRQKIGEDGSWKDSNQVNFSTLPPDCGVAIELDTEATTKLFEQLAHLYRVQEKGVQYGDQDFVVGKKEEVLIVDDSTKSQAIREMLDHGYSEDFWGALTEEDPDLASRLAIAKLYVDRRAVIDEFAAALITQPEDESYWQNLFSDNTWILQAVFSASVFILCGEAYLGASSRLAGRARAGSQPTSSHLMQARRALRSWTSRLLQRGSWASYTGAIKGLAFQTRPTPSIPSFLAASSKCAIR